MAIAYVQKGTSASVQTGSATVNAPASRTANNFLLLVVEYDGTTAPSTPSGWNAMASQTKNDGLTGNSGEALSFFWRIATATSGDNVSLAIPSGSGHVMGVILEFSGVHTTSPVDANGTSWLDTTATNTKNYTNYSTANNGAMALWFLGTAINSGTTTITQTSTNLTGFTSVGQIALCNTGSGADTGAVGFSYGTKDTAGAISGTYTGNWVVSNAVGVAFALRQAPNNASMTKALTHFSFSGSATIKINASLTKTLSPFALTGSAQVKVNASMTKALSAFGFTGSADILDIEASMNATLSTFSFSGNAEGIVEGSLDATLSAFELVGTADFLNLVSLDATLSPFGFDGAAEPLIDVSGGPILSPFAFEGSANFTSLEQIDAELDATLSPFELTGGFDDSFVPFPTDADFVIVVPELARTLPVPGLGRMITIPALDRTLEVS